MLLTFYFKNKRKLTSTVAAAAIQFKKIPWASFSRGDTRLLTGRWGGGWRSPSSYPSPTYPRAPLYCALCAELGCFWLKEKVHKSQTNKQTNLFLTWWVILGPAILARVQLGVNVRNFARHNNLKEPVRQDLEKQHSCTAQYSWNNNTIFSFRRLPF